MNLKNEFSLRCHRITEISYFKTMVASQLHPSFGLFLKKMVVKYNVFWHT